MSKKIKVSYEELKRLIVSETLLEDENKRLKERVKTLEGLYKFKCEEAEKLKLQIEANNKIPLLHLNTPKSNDEEEELLDE